MSGRGNRKTRRGLPARWQVLWYEGPATGRWRRVYEGPERQARQRYLREHARLHNRHLLLMPTETLPHENSQLFANRRRKGMFSDVLESWRRVWRDGLAPQLSAAGLEALQRALTPLR
jgi:hypothetical protein